MSSLAAARTNARSGALCALAALLLLAGTALADSGQECSGAYYQTQVLRDEGKLEDALRQAEICLRSCGPKLGNDCAQWKTALEGRIASSIVIDVTDESGAPMANVTVSLDGVVWLDHLDGSAQSISKGPHTLEVTAEGTAPQKRSIVIQSGEKNRKISIVLTKSTPPPVPRDDVHSIGPWIVGGVGVGALVAGAVTGGFVIHDHGVMRDNCDDAKGVCSQEGLDAADRGQVLGPVTTSLLVAGGALVAGGIVWLLVAPAEKERSATSWYLVPAVSGRETGLSLGGSW